MEIYKIFFTDFDGRGEGREPQYFINRDMAIHVSKTQWPEALTTIIPITVDTSEPPPRRRRR